MPKKEKNMKLRTSAQLFRSFRKAITGINPATKVNKSKKKYTRKKKHKQLDA